jgi:hypothetical protein
VAIAHFCSSQTSRSAFATRIENRGGPHREQADYDSSRGRIDVPSQRRSVCGEFLLFHSLPSSRVTVAWSCSPLGAGPQCAGVSLPRVLRRACGIRCTSGRSAE